jgi:hypothetical protein
MSFERLELAVTIIARRLDHPGKREVVADCLGDIEGRWRRGELDLGQRLRLYALLLRASSPRRCLAGAI